MLLHEDQEASIDQLIQRVAADRGKTFSTTWEFVKGFLRPRGDGAYDLGVRIRFQIGAPDSQDISVEVESCFGRVTLKAEHKLPDKDALSRYLKGKKHLLKARRSCCTPGLSRMSQGKVR